MALSYEPPKVVRVESMPQQQDWHSGFWGRIASKYFEQLEKAKERIRTLESEGADKDRTIARLRSELAETVRERNAALLYRDEER